MTTSPADTITSLEEQERRLVLPKFDQDDAWILGSFLANTARDAGHKVLIDIRRTNMVLFRAALPGTTSDQQFWAERKAAVALRMEASSALVAARMASYGLDPATIGWLDHSYALAPGAFPIRVEGVGVVAAVTASGLSSDEDHDFVVSGLEALLAGSVAR